MGSANTATHSAMWLARQLCTRIPIRGRVNQQRRGMGFFGDLKANFKKELDKNKELKEALDKMQKKKGGEATAKEGAADASAQAKPKEAKAEAEAEAEGAPKADRSAMFKDAIANLRGKVEAAKDIAKETVEAAKQSEAVKLAQEAREEILKNSGAANIKAPNMKDAAEGLKGAAGMAGESMMAKAAREAAEAIKKQAGETDAGRKVMQMQAERYAQMMEDEQEAKMASSRPKKSYFADTSAEPAPEVPEEEHDKDTQALVAVKRRSSTWEKQKNRMRRAVDGNPYLKAAWQKTEKVAEFTGDKAADLGDSCFGENDQSNTVYEIKERDPDFSMQEFLIEVREVIVPEVLQAYLTADQKTTEARCQGQAYSSIFASFQERKAMGVTFDSRIIRISEIEISGARVLEKGPTLVVTFNVQQIHCIKDKAGAVVDGADDDIRRVFYTWAFQLDDMSQDLNWQLVEMNVQGQMKMI